METEQQVAEDEVPEEFPRCPFCPGRRPFGRPAEAWHHYRAQHPEWRLVGPGPWPLLEQPAPPRILGAVYADEADVPIDPHAVRRALDRATAGFELTEAEREQIAAAVRRMTPVFEQVRRAMEAYARAVGPILAQLAESLKKVGQATQGDYALAPPRPGEPRRRGPGRRGREAQRSPYGPQGRR